MKISIQGYKGSYHDMVRTVQYPDAEIIERDTFEEIFKDLQTHNAELGIIAIENTIAGSIQENNDLLLNYDVHIIKEYSIRIAHQLMSLPNQKIEDISEVLSHPMAIKQCKEYLDNLEVKVVESHDTALSAKEIAENNFTGKAAIASKKAAEIYGLTILASDIETNKHNYTRFLVISPSKVVNKNANKASIALTLKHEPGALADAIDCFRKFNLNMTKIESRPIIGEPYNYRFYIDYEHPNLYELNTEFLKSLRNYTQEIKLLGTYIKS